MGSNPDNLPSPSRLPNKGLGRTITRRQDDGTFVATSPDAPDTTGSGSTPSRARRQLFARIKITIDSIGEAATRKR